MEHIVERSGHVCFIMEECALLSAPCWRLRSQVPPEEKLRAAHRNTSSHKTKTWQNISKYDHVKRHFTAQTVLQSMAWP